MGRIYWIIRPMFGPVKQRTVMLGNDCLYIRVDSQLHDSVDSYMTRSTSVILQSLLFLVMSCIYLARNVMSIAPYTGGPATFCSVLCQWSWHFVTSCKDGGTILRLCWYQFWVMCNSLSCCADFLFKFTYLVLDCNLLHLWNGINNLLT